MPEERCIRCGNRVPWISFLGNLAITIFKVTVGILGRSSALIADGIHSLTDVIGTGAIIATRKISSRPSDESHPYGHGKAEFLGSTFIYTVLLFLSSAIFIGGLLVILEGRIEKPRIVTLLAAVVSVFYNVFMYLFGQCAGRRNNSPAILANSFENRADAISSTACIVGIAAAIFVNPVCDPISAMMVGVIIFVNCLVQLNESLSGLMDRALPYKVIQRIRHVAMTQEGVAGVDFVKTRQTGSNYWVDLGILVPGDLDVARSDSVASEVRNELMRRSERFHNVEVFVAPAPGQYGKWRRSPRHRKRGEPQGGGS
jgi:cation diffusion facilitator family transporter